MPGRIKSAVDEGRGWKEEQEEEGERRRLLVEATRVEGKTKRDRKKENKRERKTQGNEKEGEDHLNE